MPKTVNQIIPVEPAKINKDALEKLLAAVKQIECANPSDANTVKLLLAHDKLSEAQVNWLYSLLARNGAEFKS